MIAAKHPYGRFVAVMLAVASPLLATDCAAPALSLYTLEPPDPRSVGAPLEHRALVVEVRHAVIPDYLDSQDILIRDGTRLERSARGRWASRLSTTITRYLTGVLATRYPDALVTDQPQVGTPNYRISIRISTFDVTRGGAATLEANWTIVPGNPAQPERLQRARFTATGPIATDQQVVALMESVLNQLADAMKLPNLR